MAFTRRALFLKWGSSTKYCFLVKIEGYGGGEQDKPAQYNRSLTDGSLLRVFGPSELRSLNGILLVNDSRPGTTYNDGSEDIAVGQISDLKSAHSATDLQAKSFEDDDYWDAEWLGAWSPYPVDPMRSYAEIPIKLVER